MDERTTGPLPLTSAAVATVIAAVAIDVGTGEHPSHTAGLALVAVVVATLWVKLAGRRDGVFSAVSAALVAQPALHTLSKLADPVELHERGDVVHMLAEDGPRTLMQVLAPALIVIAVALSDRVLELFIGSLRAPLRLLTSPPPDAPRRIVAPVGSISRAWLLRGCGWVIRAARRGPPRVPVPAALG